MFLWKEGAPFSVLKKITCCLGKYMKTQGLSETEGGKKC